MTVFLFDGSFLSGTIGININYIGTMKLNQFFISLFFFIIFFVNTPTVLADVSNTINTDILSNSLGCSGTQSGNFRGYQYLGQGLSGNLSQVDIKLLTPLPTYYGKAATMAIYESDTYLDNYSDIIISNLVWQQSVPNYVGISGYDGVVSFNNPNLGGTYQFLPNKNYYLVPLFFTFDGGGICQSSYFYGSSDSNSFPTGEFYIDLYVKDIYFNLKGLSYSSTTPPVLVGNSNVLFIPGLEASRLYEPTSVVGDGANQLWEPNKNADVDLLHFLDNNGQKIDPSIYTGDIIKEVNIIGTNIYKSFSNMMDGLVVQGQINDWQAHAYDWRDSVTSIVNNGTQYLDEVITLESRLRDLALTSDSGEVTIIAHSNGGLIAKSLIKKLQDDKVAGLNNLIDKIDKLILVAVPQLGTPTAIPALLHGYDQDLGLGFIMNKATARAFGVTMPGAYGLLPSPEYFNKVFTPVISFLPNIADPYMNQEISLYGNTIDSYSELESFLAGGDGRPDPGVSEIFKPIKLRSSLLDSEKVMHNQIDNLVIPSNIEVIEIAGWGLVTVSGFEYSAPKLCQYPTDNNCTGTYFIDEEPIFTIDGDKTVVTASALAGSGEKWWVNINKYNFLRLPRIGHASILEVTPLLDFILSKITDYSFTDTTYISTSIPNYNGNYLKLSVHSPVTLDAYDVDGNHTGKICPPNTDLCYVEENILNSSYLEFGEGKYINLPEDEFSRVSLQGTGIGTFTYESEKVLADGTLTTSTFVDIPVTTQTQAEITLNQSTGILELKLDVTGDGVIDFTLAPSDTFDPITYLQIMKVTIDSLDIPQAKKKAFSKRIDNTIKLIEKGKIDKAKLRADKFKSVLEKVISKPDPKKPKPKKLSKTDAQLLLDMLNHLLDNIS